MIRAILTDIEGTTSSLSFVKDVLFPYAREHLAEFVRQHGQEAEIRKLLQEVGEKAGATLNDEQAIEQLQQWMAEDRKVTPLKSLQGLIWEAGYRNGDYQGHIYDDAAACLQQWHQKGLRLYVYSSGSVYAQKLLFGHTSHGDLTPLFSGYFDTTSGAKQDAASYRNITREIAQQFARDFAGEGIDKQSGNSDLSPESILFLSDIEAELDAAREAGMSTCWLIREHESDMKAAHRQVKSFDQIEL